MSKFCFYYGEDEEFADRLRRAAIFCWEKIEEIERDSFRLFVASDAAEEVCRTDAILGVLSGYARRSGSAKSFDDKKLFFFEASGGEWALGDEWTGSFAAAAYSPGKGEVTLCNDVIGHFPLYYALCGEGFAGGTSLIALSRAAGFEPDAVGVLQRITVPFCNYGRRTLLKGVFRLMPGERVKWMKASGELRRDYDDSLCRDVIEPDVKTAARMVWDCLREEIAAAADGERKIAVAMSGGWDSRLVLGGIAEQDSALRCLTYGDEDHYETNVARRCAEVVGASHESFSIEDMYFPPRRKIEPLARETESANYFEWFGMIEKARTSGEKNLLLLGDLCESIDGRYMTAFSSRGARVRSFFRSVLGKSEIFAPAEPAVFERWRKEKQAEITAQLLANVDNLSDKLTASLTKEKIVEETAADLELSFERVRAAAPPFAAMYDELFIWFHRIRFLLGNQITWLGAAFRPVSPGLSMRFLRLVTRIHPRLKIRKRLMNAVIGLPEFDRLAAIPSAQIPFVGSRAPAFIRDAVWAARFGIDQVLIRKSLRNKKAESRQRALASLDYVKEYRRASSGANVEGWFSNEYIKGDYYLKLFRRRAALDAWTLINVDIAAPANVGFILDLCDVSAEAETKIRPERQLQVMGR